MHELEFNAEKDRVLQYCQGKSALTEYYSGDVNIVKELETAVVGTGICRAPQCPINGTVAELSSEQLNWSFAGSCFFCFTVITTIGYGNYVPVTVGGRLFTICFAIPGFVLHAFTVQNFTKLIDDNLYTKNVSLIRRVATSLVIVVLWLLIMAAVYSDTEGWEYGDAFYFSYITTTSIGLGDFSPTLTRDWLSSYLLIYVGLVLMTSFIESFIHIFHTSVIHAGTVNLEEKTQDEAKGAGEPCAGIVQAVENLLYYYLHNWKFKLTVLWLSILVYMFVGASIFRQIEVFGLSDDSSARGATLSAFSAVSGGATDFSSFVQASLANSTHSLVSDDGKVKAITGQWDELKGLMNNAGTCPTPLKLEKQWAVANGAIFCLTLFTAIGYGNVVPATHAGKVFCIIYSIIGFVLYAKVQTVTILWLNIGINRRVDSMGEWYNSCFSREFEYFRLGVSLGFLSLLISAACFTATEHWTFFEAFWFAFISTCTIGLGDYTPLFLGVNFFIQFGMIAFGLSAMGLVVHIIYLYGTHWTQSCFGSHAHFSNAHKEPKTKEEIKAHVAAKKKAKQKAKQEAAADKGKGKRTDKSKLSTQMKMKVQSRMVV